MVLRSKRQGGASTNRNYCVYHLHTDYSLVDSCSKFEEYVDAAVAQDMPAIAFTEHGKSLGWVRKKLYCDERGIKYIHGVEIYLTEQLEPKIRDNYHTVLLAKNLDGVRELNRLIGLSSDEQHFYYTNRISFDEFLQISDNIIKTSACLASPLNKLDDSHPRYLELASHYDYLEVQPHISDDQKAFNVRLLELSRRIGKPLIAGTDTHNSSAYKAECRKALMKYKDKTFGNEDDFDLTWKTYDELLQMFVEQGALPNEAILQAINNTNVMAASVEDFELDRSIKYPILYGSREEDSRKFDELIARKLEEKLRSGVISAEQEPAFRSAIAEEVRVFRKLQMDGFMLSMAELLGWCREQGMAIGTARGSVGGSRVAYVIDIIDLNPETWHTVFSRFCNEDREEIGDIDIDVVESDRPAIFQHIINRFGTSHTARVGSYGRSIFDMSLVTACIRPSGASYRDELLARKPHKNPSEIIDNLLSENLGYLIYQEDTIKFLQEICGLSGSQADNIRRAIGRKQKDRLDAAMPDILEGYCSKSPKPRAEAESEAKEFLQIIEDSASYQFG